MTKKDYILLARVINPLIKTLGSYPDTEINIHLALNQFVYQLCEKLQEDNHLFDKQRFINAINE